MHVAFEIIGLYFFIGLVVTAIDLHRNGESDDTALWPLTVAARISEWRKS